MASSFPTSIDNFTNNVDNVDTVVAQDVNDLNDAVEALEAKVGADSSAVSTSHDYKLNAITSSWTSYTPTPTNFVVGNGQLVAYYSQIGKTVHVRVGFLLGSTSSVSGNITFTLPVTSISYPTASPLGVCTMTDTGTTAYPGWVYWVSTTTARITALELTLTYGRDSGTSSSVPFTWTTNDEFGCHFTYEAA